MKRIFLAGAIIAAGFYTNSATAQTEPKPSKVGLGTKDTLRKVYFGVKAGANMNMIKGNLTFLEEYTPGYAGGGFIKIERKKFGIQVEGLISNTTYNFHDSGSTVKSGSFSLVYLDIPIMLQVKALPFLWVQAGAQFSTLLSVSEDPKGVNDPKNYFQASNYSFIGGLEGQLPKNFSIGVRYTQGFTNMHTENSTADNQEWKSSAIQLYIGYHFK